MLRNYIKTAIAVLLRRKFFTAVSLFGVAFTLSVLLVATAVLDDIFSKKPPEVNQHRTLGIFRVNLINTEKDGNDVTSALAGYELIDKVFPRMTTVEMTGFCRFQNKIISYTSDKRIESYVKYTDANFWKILQFEFLEGRPFTQDEVENAQNLMIINQATRRKYFGSESALNKKITILNREYKIAGVVENVSFLRLVPFADIWLPYTTQDNYRVPNEFSGTYIGLFLARSKNDFDAIIEQYDLLINGLDLSVLPRYNKIISMPESVLNNVGRLIFNQGMDYKKYSQEMYMIGFILSLFFMVLPAINIVNLASSRILERSSEIGIRKAFGAPRTTLLLQFITENLVLTLLGGILAAIMAALILSMISITNIIPYAKFTINWQLFAYGMAAALVFSFLSGFIPAFRMSKLTPVNALRGGGI